STLIFFLPLLLPPISTLFPYTTLFRSILTLVPVLGLAVIAFSGRRISWRTVAVLAGVTVAVLGAALVVDLLRAPEARTHLGRVRSEEHTSELRHRTISYAVFCLKKKKK